MPSWKMSVVSIPPSVMYLLLPAVMRLASQSR